MTDNNGVGVTVISHDSESRKYVRGCERPQERVSLGWPISPASLRIVNSLSSTKCYHSKIFRNDGFAWWVSRDSTKMTYWGGASVNGNCPCGITNSCANPCYGCNCDKNDYAWREDNFLLTDQTKLSAKQLRFGDAGLFWEKDYHTLGKLKFYGTA